MIIINTGIPKSGTTLLFGYQMNILKLLSVPNGLKDSIKPIIGSLYVPSFSEEVCDNLKRIHEEYGNLVVKTHLPPDRFIRNLVEKHGAKVTCCFRDPRDIILSALDHGARTRSGLDESGAFGDIYSIQDGIHYVKEWMKIYHGWLNEGNAMMVQYEHFIPEQVATIRRMNDFLGIFTEDELILKLWKKYDRMKINNLWNFNKGVSYRWRIELQGDDLKKCNEGLYQEILSMGYSID